MFGQSLLSAFGSAACTTDTDQLFATDVQTTSLATYQLNNATTSIPSNTYPGTPSNITYAAGKFGNAAVFNGSNAYISASGSWITGNNPFSVSIWVNSTSTGLFFFLGNSTTSGSLNTSFYISVETGGAVRVGDFGTDLFTSSTSVGDGNWHHVAFTSDGTTSKLYIDGSESNSTLYTWAISAAFMEIGRGTSNYYFNGKIDQVRVFNSALPQAAVTALYNETTTTATYPYVDYQLANPNSVAYYKMSDATDQFGNYNGTASNVNFNTVGKFGFAGAFNGSSSRIAIPNIVNQAADHSVSLWIKPTNFSSNRGALSMFNGSHLLVYVTTDGGMNSNGGASSDGTTAGTITANSWNNIVFTYNYASTTYTMYVNGVNKGTSANFNFSGRTNSIGCHNAGSSFIDYFLGSIDQVRIYDSALSAENVTTLYEEIECPAVAVTNAFNTVLYTGNSSTQAITGVGFTPDLTWIKRRDGTENHYLQDSVRGSTQQIYTNLTNSQFNETTAVTSFSANGFNMGSYNGINNSGETYVAWNWKAGGADVLNEEGTIDSQVSANVDAGFSVVSWTTTSAAAWNVGHGLGTAPSVIISKMTTTAGTWWEVYHSSLGTGKYLALQTTGATYIDAGAFSSVTDTTWTSYTTNTLGSYIAYCFAEVEGYSRIGSYVGTGATGNVQYVGFEPAFVMMKAYSTTSDWFIVDNKRNANNPRNSNLRPNNSNAESNAASGLDFLSNGFEFTGAAFNDSGVSWIFMAIA